MDDSRTVIESFKLQLEKVGFEVVGHLNAFGTLPGIISAQPDVVMLDVEMPMLEGPALVKMMRANPSVWPKLSKTPVLLYSSLAESELASRVRECGADGYIHKSWPVDRVVNALRQQLRRVAG